VALDPSTPAMSRATKMRSQRRLGTSARVHHALALIAFVVLVLPFQRVGFVMESFDGVDGLV
jgi:hypothetical protein